MSEVSRLLDAAAKGDASAAGQLLPLVYDELRRLAARQLSHEAPGHSLQPTALVHEAYLRLVGDGDEPRSFADRGHFLARSGMWTRAKKYSRWPAAVPAWRSAPTAVLTELLQPEKGTTHVLFNCPHSFSMRSSHSIPPTVVSTVSKCFAREQATYKSAWVNTGEKPLTSITTNASASKPLNARTVE